MIDPNLPGGLQPRDVRLRLLGELSHGLVHDYAQMLQIILWQTESLLREAADPSLRHRAELIQKAAGACASLSQRVLDQMRATGPAEGSPREPLDLALVVCETVELWAAKVGRMKADGRHVEILPHLDGPLWVWGRADDLRHVLNNLISNALDALREWGRIDLVASRRDAWVVFEVLDNGCGMDAPTLARCLEPEFTTKGGVGSGLGLSNALAMVRRQGGELTVESQPGAGTRVRILLRTADEPARARAAMPVRRAAAPRGEGLGVLIVDDEIDVANVLGEMCALEGLPATLAHEARAGVAAFDPAVHHVVVLDLGLPDETGLWAAARIRERDPSVAIVLLTGWQDEALAAPARRVVDLQAGKPIGYDRFVALLDSAFALQQQRARRLDRGPQSPAPGLRARA